MPQRAVRPKPRLTSQKKTTSLSWSCLLWVAVGSIVTVIVGVFFYLSPLFAEFRNQTSADKAEEVVQPLKNPDQTVDFEFYEVLPKQEFYNTPFGVSVQDKDANQPSVSATPDVVVRADGEDSAPPDETMSEEATDGTDGTDSQTGHTQEEHGTNPDQGTTYILQIRSYTSADEADFRRAEVLLTGVDAIVVRRDNDDGTHFYQVISKPMNSREEAVRANQRLKGSGIDALIVEQKH